MKYKILLTSAAIFTAFSVSALAGPICQYLPGGVTCSKGTVSVVNGIGLTNLNGTTVTDHVNACGAFDAESSDINKFSIIGAANFTDSTVKSDSKEVGLLTSEKTGFSNLYIISSVVNLSNSVANNINVDCSDATCRVYLKNTSLVNGNIKFNNFHGVVYLSAGSKISGKVINGKIIKN